MSYCSSCHTLHPATLYILPHYPSCHTVRSATLSILSHCLFCYTVRSATLSVVLHCPFFYTVCYVPMSHCLFLNSVCFATQFFPTFWSILSKRMALLPHYLEYFAVFRIRWVPGFFAYPDPGFKSPDPSIYNLMESK